jgi:hypothetical protein
VAELLGGENPGKGLRKTGVFLVVEGGPRGKLVSALEWSGSIAPPVWRSLGEARSTPPLKLKASQQNSVEGLFYFMVELLGARTWERFKENQSSKKSLFFWPTPAPPLAFGFF